jgi:hypothetical protein
MRRKEATVLVIALGPAKQILKTGTKIVACTVSESDLAISSVPGLQIVPLRRLGLGISVLLDIRGSEVLDLLGDDVAAPADTVARFLCRDGDGDGGGGTAASRLSRDLDLREGRGARGGASFSLLSAIHTPID